MRMYDDLAPWWPLLSAPEEYEEEAAIYERLLLGAGVPRGGRVLELGSGGGNNASHLKRTFEMVLVEPSDGMRAVSAALNPECEHQAGDMRTVRLGRLFDAVFVHDAVCYMTGTADLRLAVETAFVHCRPGGTALFAPDYVRETFRAGTDHGGHDGRDGSGRALRYLEWTWDPDPSDATYCVDYTIQMREADGSVRIVHDRHDEGLFARSEWLRVFREAGFDACVESEAHSELDGPYELFVARKPLR